MSRINDPDDLRRGFELDHVRPPTPAAVHAANCAKIRAALVAGFPDAATLIDELGLDQPGPGAAPERHDRPQHYRGTKVTGLSLGRMI